MPKQETDPEQADVQTVAERREQHPLVDLLANPSRVAIFAALHDAPSPMNPQDIVDSVGLSRNAWYDNYETLEEYGVIEQNGSHGNSPLYELADDDDLVDALRKASDIAGARRREERESDAQADG